jgi:hypothetical protein
MANGFGRSVDWSGDVIAVGATRFNRTGGVAVVRNGSVAQMLTSPLSVSGDDLGVSVAVEDNLIVAGAWNAMVEGMRMQGALFVFTADESGNFSFTRRLHSAAIAALPFNSFVFFGGALTMTNGVILASAEGHLGKLAVHFHRNDTTRDWDEGTIIHRSDIESFGRAIALTNDTAVICGVVSRPHTHAHPRTFAPRLLLARRRSAISTALGEAS